MQTPGPTTAPPLTLWQQTWRILAALLCGLLLWTSVVAAATTETQEFAAVLDLGLGLVAVALLGWHRRAPFLIAVLTGLLTTPSTAAVGAASIALISLATRRRPREMAVMFVIMVAGTYLNDLLFPFVNDDLPWWVLGIIGVLFYGICVAIGLYIGARRDLVASYRARAETAEREQAMRVGQAKTNERARIAREMHDVLAHRISLVAMHAGALAYRDDLSRAETMETATVVRDNAHRALSDLRDVLGVLRDTDVSESSIRPQPTLVDLDELVRDNESAGTPVRMRLDVHDVDTVPDTTARHAYRILQESLTNARKHAPGEPVDLTLTGEPGGRLVLTVRNGIPTSTRGAAEPVLPSSGMGLMGLAERALLSGGELSFGPTATGTYVVHAWLPWAS